MNMGNVSLHGDFNNATNISCSVHIVPEMKMVSKLILFSVFSVFIFGAIILNILLIVQINRRKKHKEFTRFFLTSMAAADLFVGMTLMPFSIANELTEMKQFLGPRTCSLMNSADVMLTSASIIHLSILTFERYIALCRPFSYMRICCRRNMIFLFLMCWLVVATISFGFIMPGFHHTGIEKHILTCNVHVLDRCRLIVGIYYELIISALTFFIPGFLILGLNIRVMSHVRKQSRKRKYVLRSEYNHNQRNGSETQSMRIARTIAILTGCFFVCWLPFFIVNKIIVFTNYSFPYIAEEVVLWLGYANSSMNPLLYLLLQSKSCIGKR
ncbi:trace amine-associated receptor 1-like [Mercenaria mercenaria]|uniref:trace amine-associated receptor 1-like n=1 Tax=Mercenaria mercenaria TaxID=6596 RepID=UPI001E1DCD57|nr:trace amine-associated receptor 1-like [Mercenaria mercenaria]